MALDLGVDTTTPAGELVANVMAAVAQWERRTIGQRTREGLAAKRASGVRLGRPPVLPAEVVARIVHDRAAGRTLQAIADSLTAEDVSAGRPATPTATDRAGHWAMASLQRRCAPAVPYRLARRCWRGPSGS